jgi:hypothetical protein
MAKAEYTSPMGMRVAIEGSPREVAELLRQLNSTTTVGTATTQRGKNPKYSSAKATPSNLIASLIDGGFFKKPKDLASIKVSLEESGHYYPVTTLSPILLRFVRSKQLRRIKENKRWLYTGV